MAQIILPVSDIAVGSWTTAPLWSKVDDDSVAQPTGDGVVATSDAVGNGSTTTLLDLELDTAATDPLSSIGHIIRCRWFRTTSKSMQGTCELWQGVPGTGTLIATLQQTDVTATERVDTYALSGTEIDNITDYGDLHLRLYGDGNQNGGARSLVVELCELETPPVVTHYDIPADGGSYDIAGAVAGLAVGRKVAADNYDYAISGTDVTFKRTYAVNAEGGSHGLTGADVALKKHYVLIAEGGSYTLTGADAGLGVGRKLPADGGAYALTGAGAGLAVGRKVPADGGSYALTGTAATLTKSGSAKEIDAEGGSYAIAGADVTFKRHYVLMAESGSYTLSGTDATLAVARKLSAEGGSYTLSGTDATLAVGRKLPANAGVYTLAGADATFKRTYAVSADAGAYTLTGADATLTFSGTSEVLNDLEAGTLEVWALVSSMNGGAA